MSADPTTIIGCYVCRQNWPLALCHEHHKTPQAAGGKDTSDNLVYLCAGCHNHLHRIADYLRHGKQGIALEIANAAYPAPATRKRVLDLAVHVQIEMETRGHRDLDDDARLEVWLLHKEVLQLRNIANTYKHANGRKMGAATFAAAIIRDFLRKRRT